MTDPKVVAIISAFGKFTGDLRLAKRDVLAGAFLQVLADDGWTLARADEATAQRAALMFIANLSPDADAEAEANALAVAIHTARAALAAPEPAAKENVMDRCPVCGEPVADKFEHADGSSPTGHRTAPEPAAAPTPEPTR